MNILNESFDSSYPFDKVEKYGAMDIVYSFNDEKDHSFKLHFEKRVSFGKFVYVAVLSQKTPNLKMYKRVFGKFQNAQKTISTILMIMRDIHTTRKDVKGVVLELPPHAFGPYAGLIRKIANRELRSLFTIPNIEFTSDEFEDMGLHGFVLVARPNNFKNVFTGKTFLELLNGKDLDSIQPEDEPSVDYEPEVLSIPMPKQKLDTVTPLSQQLAPKRQVVQVEIQEEINSRKKVPEGLEAKPNELDFAKFFILSIFFRINDNGEYSLSDEEKMKAYANEEMISNALAQSTKGSWIQRIPLADISKCLIDSKIRCKSTSLNIRPDQMRIVNLEEIVDIVAKRFPSATDPNLNLSSRSTALPVNDITKNLGEAKIAKIIQRAISNDDAYRESIRERFKYTSSGKVETTLRSDRHLIQDFINTIKNKEILFEIQDYIPDSMKTPWEISDYDTFKKSFILSWLFENVKPAKVASAYGTRFIEVNSNIDEFYSVFHEDASKDMFETPKIEIQFKRIYNEMQQMLFNQYGEQYQGGEGTIELYRGINISTSNYTPASVESWSVDFNIAKEFSDGGTILSAHVPFKYILMNKDFMIAQNVELGQYGIEEEWIVLGGAFKTVPIKKNINGVIVESAPEVMNIVLANDPHFKEIFPNDVAVGVTEEEILRKELKHFENQLDQNQTDRLKSEGLLESRSSSFGGRHLLTTMEDDHTMSYKMKDITTSYFKRCLENLLECEIQVLNGDEIKLKLKI